MNARLFLALWPDPALRAQLAAARDRWNWPRQATPVRSERLHLTLHFIGEVAPEAVARLADALPAPTDSIALTLGRHVLWPHGVAVLEPDSTPPALTDLHATLAAVLLAHALPLESRAYKPHVTLARRAAAALAPPAAAAISWQTDRYALVQSRDGHYEVLREYVR